MLDRQKDACQIDLSNQQLDQDDEYPVDNRSIVAGTSRMPLIGWQHGLVTFPN